VTTFVRGAGGWGGDRGPAGDAHTPLPERAPDAVIEEKTLEDQALLYRLSGDVNPLHADPGFASNFGFQKPILHGLCTYGFAARHVVKGLRDGDPRSSSREGALRGRRCSPARRWSPRCGARGTKVVFRTKVKERDKVVLSGAAVELFAELPNPGEEGPRRRSSAAAGPRRPGGAEETLVRHLRRHREVPHEEPRAW
jgi:3-hydroxyacyl-CoA dehydrogenase/3a,7a,12a-trihydroxy-5b-cholest-24-enoyl-CoA hydratase